MAQNIVHSILAVFGVTADGEPEAVQDEMDVDHEPTLADEALEDEEEDGPEIGEDEDYELMSPGGSGLIR